MWWLMNTTLRFFDIPAPSCNFRWVWLMPLELPKLFISAARRTAQRRFKITFSVNHVHQSTHHYADGPISPRPYRASPIRDSRRRTPTALTIPNARLAGRPDPLRNCSIINQTSHSLEVECRSGFDGGLPQYFVAELFDLAGHRLLRNLTRPFPDFAVTDLPAGLELRLQLYAANSRGRSRAVTLHGFTLKMPEKGASMGGDSGKSGQIKTRQPVCRSTTYLYHVCMYA